MKGKNNASARHLDIDPAVLAELFPSDDSVTLYDFDESSLSAVGRIITYTSAVGGVCSFYRSNANNALCISIRVGERKRSLQLDGDDVDAVFLDQLANGIQRIYLAQLQLREATSIAEQATKGKKKK